ncbi:MAG: LptF/LptG family permease [Gammaproteobacteria bacterium]
MIYRRAHIADCARHMGAVFPAALIVGGLIFLSRLLAETVADALPVSSVWQFLALALIKYMPQLLVVSLFAGALLAVERSFRQREMAAWFAAGIGLRHFVLPGVMFALPVIFAVALLSCALSPWSVRAADTLRAQLTGDLDPRNIRPGEFGVVPGGAYTYFFSGGGGQESEKSLNVFVAGEDDEAREIISARAAYRARDERDDFISLENGAFYRLPKNGEDAPEIVSFARMDIYPPSPEVRAVRPRGAAFSDLRWDDPRARTEIVWRINQPLAALFFALLAPMLGGAFARGRRHGFMAALLLFVIHLNLMYFARDQMAAGLHFIPAMLLAPGTVFAAALLLRRAPTR